MIEVAADGVTITALSALLALTGTFTFTATVAAVIVGMCVCRKRKREGRKAFFVFERMQ